MAAPMSESNAPATTPDAAVSSPQGTSRGQLRDIIESLADGIVIVDREGVIRFANPAAARLFDRSPDGLVGTVLGTPLVAGETTEMEIVQRGGGDVVYAELRVVQTEWDDETMELVSLRDVTDRKYGEERSRQLAHEREARLQAEAASRTKSDFLAMMSHELRTPLNAILGYSELIELGISGAVNPTMQQQIGRIRSSAKHLLSLVNDILDLAKVEAGRLSVANAPERATEAVASALALVQPQAATRNLSLVVAPGIDALPSYIGDAERVRQILVNLLSNAVKCTDPGGTITIDGVVTSAGDAPARLQPRQVYVRLSVTDTGVGIPPDKLAAIFEPFVQAESGATRTREGSGLGLTIGQRLARAMGGDLTVESIVGTGSSFHLWLPAGASSTPALPAVDADGMSNGEVRRTARTEEMPANLSGLCELATGVLAGLEPLMSVVIQRIRCDPALPMAAGLRTSQVSDHLSTLLADIAGALMVIEEAAGQPSPLLSDAVQIQRLLAERHGAQRARLGWTEPALRREFMIIREELEALVRRTMDANAPLREVDALTIINRFVDRAEFIAVRELEKDVVE
jgi:signal transduction histidine kinase